MIKRITGIVLCLSLVFVGAVFFPTGAQAADIKGNNNYTIENPYKDVVWSGTGAWNSYKASLHSHTNASDAVPSIAESVEKHYELGFDILAISDHAVLGAKWSENPDTVPIYRFFKFGNTGMKNLEVLSEERRQEIINGVGRNGRGMLEVTGAVEANGATPINDCHVNAFFADYGQALMGVYGDYETVVRRVEKQGGITFLDHVGEYVGCEDDPERAKEDYYSNKLASVLAHLCAGGTWNLYLLAVDFLLYHFCEPGVLVAIEIECMQHLVPTPKVAQKIGYTAARRVYIVAYCLQNLLCFLCNILAFA